jgi:hypothetical protein
MHSTKGSSSYSSSTGFESCVFARRRSSTPQALDNSASK